MMKRILLALLFLVIPLLAFAADTTPPGDISDLSVASYGSNVVALQWTVPGDNAATGHAAQYDVRYSTSEINSGNFASATRWTTTTSRPIMPGLDNAGVNRVQQTGVFGLTPSTTYYFAMKTADADNNWSGISNAVSQATSATGTVTDISTCQTLASAGTTYRLTADLNSVGSCMTINASNVTLDLNGYTVVYDNTGTSVMIPNGDFEEDLAGNWDISGAPQAARTANGDVIAWDGYHLAFNDMAQDQVIVSDWGRLPTNMNAVAYLVRPTKSFPAPVMNSGAGYGAVFYYEVERKNDSDNTISTVASTYKLTSTGIAFDNTTGTITRAAGGFLTGQGQRLVVGDLIKVSGSVSNDGVYKIKTVTDNTITLYPIDPLVRESAGSSVTIYSWGLGGTTNFAKNELFPWSTGSTAGQFRVKLTVFKEYVFYNWNNTVKSITYSTWIDKVGISTYQYQGVSTNSNRTGTTVKNGVIRQGDGHSFHGYGVSFDSGASSGTVQDVRIETNGIVGIGVNSSYCDNMMVQRAKITAESSYDFRRGDMKGNVVFGLLGTGGASTVRYIDGTSAQMSGIVSSGSGSLNDQSGAFIHNNYIQEQSNITNKHALIEYNMTNWNVYNNYVDADPGQGLEMPSGATNARVHHNEFHIRSLVPNSEYGWFSFDGIRLNDYGVQNTYQELKNNWVFNNNIYIYGQTNDVYRHKSGVGFHMNGILNNSSGQGNRIYNNYIRAVAIDNDVLVSAISPGSMYDATNRRANTVLYDNNVLESDGAVVQLTSYASANEALRFSNNTLNLIPGGMGLYSDSVTCNLTCKGGKTISYRYSAGRLTDMQFLDTTFTGDAVFESPPASTGGLAYYNRLDLLPVTASAVLNDLVVGGRSTDYGATVRAFIVEIDGTGTPNTFKWSNDNGATYTSGVAITGAYQALANGVQVKFAGTSGHTMGDNWRFSMPQEAFYHLDWTFDPTVKDGGDSPIQGATVTITDNAGLLVYTGSTGADGKLTTVPELVQTRYRTVNAYANPPFTALTKTPHTVAVTRSGYDNYSQPYTITAASAPDITMSGAGGEDTTPPVQSSLSPYGTLTAGATSTTLSLSTNENATCKYGTTIGTAYDNITSTFSTTGSLSHQQLVTGLTDGSSHTYYVRCSDSLDNKNTADNVISFSVGSPPADVTPPIRSLGEPSGMQVVDTIFTVMRITTDEVATCKYDNTAETAYASMAGTFDNTAGLQHAEQLTGLTNGSSHTYYVRCIDEADNANDNDYTVSFSVAPEQDTTAPTISLGSPSGVLASGTTAATLSVTTVNEASTCKYGTTGDTQYSDIANTFSTTGGQEHSQSISGLADGGSYVYYVRCQDSFNNVNASDFTISFSVANATPHPDAKQAVKKGFRSRGGVTIRR
jgi:hypothetical protein